MAVGVKFWVWVAPVTVMVTDAVVKLVVPEFTVTVHLEPEGTIAVLEGMDNEYTPLVFICVVIESPGLNTPPVQVY